MRLSPPQILSLVILSALFNVPSALAQAGSRPPLYFDSQNTFFYSGTSIAASQSGQTAQLPMFPEGILELPESSHYLLWAELDSGRLSVLENRGAKGFMLLKRIPISIGKLGVGKQFEGDKKTPVGVYLFTSFLGDSSLDDYYGLGAYPLNYPNALDKLTGRTGHGIWLHGLPKEVSERPFLDSDGCVIIDNESLLALANEIAPGRTQMVMSREPIRWIAATEKPDASNELASAIQQWKTAWEGRTDSRYLNFYAPDFNDLQRDKPEWDAYKSRVNAGKSFIRVELSDISMLQSPAERDLVDVKFYQRYASNDYAWQGWKHQLWRHEDDGWKIVYEGSN